MANVLTCRKQNSFRLNLIKYQMLHLPKPKFFPTWQTDVEFSTSVLPMMFSTVVSYCWPCLYHYFILSFPIFVTKCFSLCCSENNTTLCSHSFNYWLPLLKLLRSREVYVLPTILKRITTWISYNFVASFIHYVLSLVSFSRDKCTRI